MTSLRRRLLVGIGAVVSIAFLLTGVLVLVLARVSLRDQLDDGLRAQAAALTGLVEQDAEGIESELASVRALDHAYVQLWSADGETISRSPNLPYDLAPGSGIEDVDLGDGTSARQITIRFEPRYDEPVAQPRRATLVLARATTEIDATITRIAIVLLVAGLLGTLASLLAARWLVGYSLEPLRSLATRIAEIRETDLAIRLADTTTPVEVQPLVARLDELLGRLERAFSRERELTAEVAHELRTPIGGLRSTIELALDRERPSERYRAALSDCLAITLQTQRMVEVLLSLARLDASPGSGTSTPDCSTSIDELARQLVTEHEPRATERRLSIETNLAPALATADREQLRVVLANALDNAISYATEGSTIRVWTGVSTGSSTAHSRIEIANATSLDPADATHVFERFWRGDRARTAGLHAGLGLALCKKLVERMHGTIRVDVANDTFTLTIEIPSSTSAEHA